MCGMWEKRGSRHPSSPGHVLGPRGPTPLSHLIRHGLSLSHAASWRPIPAHPLPTQEGRCRQKMSTPSWASLLPRAVREKRQRQTSSLPTESTGKYHLYKELGGREGFWALQRKKQGTEGLVAASTKTEVHGWSTTCRLCPEQMVRSKSSGSPKPTTLDQSHRVSVSHFPISRFEERARCLQFAQLQQPWFSPPVRSVCCWARGVLCWLRTIKSPTRCIEHRYRRRRRES